MVSRPLSQKVKWLHGHLSKQSCGRYGTKGIGRYLKTKLRSCIVSSRMSKIDDDDGQEGMRYFVASTSMTSSCECDDLVACASCHLEVVNGLLLTPG